MTTDEVHSFPHSFIHSLEEEEEFIASAKGRYGWGRHPYTQDTARICQRMNLAVANELITDKSVHANDILSGRNGFNSRFTSKSKN